MPSILDPDERLREPGTGELDGAAAAPLPFLTPVVTIGTRVT
jgi:hypothetical protein